MVKLSRKAFVEKYGATCNNFRNSWSFVNHNKKFVIFGTWDQAKNGDGAVILSKKWVANESGRKYGSYKESRKHIRLITEEGYALHIFPMVHSDENQDEDGIGPSKIRSFTPVLYRATLNQVGDEWLAIKHDVIPIPNGIYPDASESNVTEKDLIFAELIFPILLGAVNEKTVLTYGDVARIVKERYPDNQVAQGIIPVIVGRRLGAIWRFTKDQGCPHIGALIINQHTNECGEGITTLLDPVAERKKVYEYPWDNIEPLFGAHLEREKAQKKTQHKKLKPIKKEAATELFFKYFTEQNDLPIKPAKLAPFRNEIIELVMKGHEPETALGFVLKDVLVNHRIPLSQRSGYIYIGHYVASDTDSPIFDQVKIGYTTNTPEIRAQQLTGGVKGPLEFKIINTWKMSSGLAAYAAEQAMHGELNEFRQNGEFFSSYQGWIVDRVEEIINLEFCEFLN